MDKVMYDPMRNLFFTMPEVVDEFGNSRGSWTCVPDSTPGEFIYTVVPAASPSYTVKHSELIPRALSDVPKPVYARVRSPNFRETAPPVHTEPPCGSNLPTNPKQLYGDKKVPMGLVPASFIAHTSTALLEGVLKYGAWNFRASPVEAMTYAHAALRHIEKWVNGEECDPQSKVHHLGNAAACMAILLDTMAHGTLIDNRPPAQDLNNLFTQLEGTIAHLREIHKDAKPTHYTNGSAGTTA